jgi:serine/threonine protein phosphatase PrpC
VELSAAARVRQGSPWGCDDRARIVDDGRLCLVADGSGPTYGGYHDPIALDPGLDVIAAALAPDRHGAHACDEACLRDAFLRANETMWAACEAFLHAFEEERAAGGDDDRVAASLRAGQRVARDRFGRALDSHAHTGGSVTGLHIAGGRAFVAQVGLCRAYRWRAGALELLLPDDGVWRKTPETADDRFYGITGGLLGVAPTAAVTTRAVDCATGDRFVLCSDGAWGVVNDGAIAAACEHPRAEGIVAAIVDAAKPIRDDAAVVAVVIA